MKKVSFPQSSIFICDGSKCGKHKDFRKALKQEFKRNADFENVEIFKMECSSRCKFAPILSVQPANQWYHSCSTDDIPEILIDIKNSSL